ncbi:MAG: NADH-quinone oxidoreductase subunit A [Bacteroidota bacterium]
MDSEFGGVLIFLLGSLAFLQIGLLGGRLLRPRTSKNPETQATYECGEETVPQQGGTFSIRFYLIALAFVLFEVEILFLFAWTLALPEGQAQGLGAFLLIEVAFFVGLLLLGLAYLWKKGFLSWLSTKPQKTPIQPLHLPNSLYLQTSNTDE